MPAIEEDDLWQKAVLWIPQGRPDKHGEIKVAQPDEIDCRWITKRRVVRDAQGNAVTLEATVVVRQQIPTQSIMLLGRISEWLGTGSADTTNDELMQVYQYDETPDLDNIEIRRTVEVTRYKGTLPAYA